ncbi:P-loop containing nucleoside triphosphate hydrolase protein [Mycena amicta]|nr:P-loop containing nucleoside triphosphate hydrolase protein [Mycena amicta]
MQELAERLKPFPVEQLNSTGEHLQSVGTNSGLRLGYVRSWRCGWLDFVVLRHSCMINGYDMLNLTKLDVLDALPEIKIGVKYKVDGAPLPGFPADLGVLGAVEVQYVMLAGWQTSISEIHKYEDLPENCQRMVLNLGSQLETTH